MGRINPSSVIRGDRKLTGPVFICVSTDHRAMAEWHMHFAVTMGRWILAEFVVDVFVEG